MLLINMQQVFLGGFFGAIVLEIIHWYNVRRKASFPKYARSWQYWIITFAMAVSGGVLAILYFGSRAEGILAFHVGLSAPLILQKLATTIATTPGAKGNETSVLDFFRW